MTVPPIERTARSASPELGTVSRTITESADPGAAVACATSAGSALKKRFGSIGIGRVSVVASERARTARSVLVRALAGR